MSDAPDTHGGGGGHTSFLKKRFGAFPWWVWALIFAAMLALGFWWKRRRAATANIGGNVVGGDAGLTGDNLGTETQDGFVSNGGTSSFGSSGGTTTGSGISSNAQWGQQAANALIGQGQDPSTVQSAISAYLSGQPLTPAQQAIINSALQQAGTPPQGVLAVATPNPSISHKVIQGETITSIAQEFYGDPSKWKQIFAANQSVIGADPLRGLKPNMTLVLPGDGLLNNPSGTTQQSIPSSHTYVAQYGDNAYQLSVRFYGTPTMQDAIRAKNPGVFKPGVGPNQNNDYAAPGTVIKLP